ncbi:unnamed protein product [Sphacelaria rigidula]
MRTGPGDDELNGAAAALLGLHSSARASPPSVRVASPGPVSTPMSPSPPTGLGQTTTTRPPSNSIPLTKHRTYPDPWNNGNGKFVFSARQPPAAAAPPVAKRARSVDQRQFAAPEENDYPPPLYSRSTAAVTAATVGAPVAGSEFVPAARSSANHNPTSTTGPVFSSRVCGGSGPAPQDPSDRRNNFLGNSFVRAGGHVTPSVVFASTAAYAGWVKPPGAATARTEQHQHQLQPLLASHRSSPLPNFGESSPNAVQRHPQTGAAWHLPRGATPATPEPPPATMGSAVHHDHLRRQQQQQQQQQQGNRPAVPRQSCPPPREPMQPRSTHQVVRGPVFRLERSGSANTIGGGRWTQTQEGGKDHGRPTSIGQDVPVTVPNSTSPPRQQLPPPSPRFVQPCRQNVRQQHDQRQEREQQQQPQVRAVTTQHRDRASMNHLWSLIPGTLEQQQRLSDHDHHHQRATIADEERRGYEATTLNRQQQGMIPLLPGGKRPRGLVDGASGRRRYAPDVHPPLSDTARRHRARAASRLRARRQALAAAAATAAATGGPGSPKSSSLSRFESNASTASMDSVDSGGGGGGGGGVVAESDGGNSGGPGADNNCGSSSNDKDEKAEGSSSIDRVVADGDAVVGSGGGGGDIDSDASGNGGKAVAASPGSNNKTNNDNNDSSNGSSSSLPKVEVGHLFELMRSVSATAIGNTSGAGRGAGGVCSVSHGGLIDSGGSDGLSNGGEDPGESREIGKPVKYKHRQIAARSRKRTRGRFVSEKAPAFVSITEFMAQRSAERERQREEKIVSATPAVVSGVGAG